MKDYYYIWGIKRKYNISNTVDFLIHNESDTLLLEAKSAEMAELTPHNPEMKY